MRLPPKPRLPDPLEKMEKLLTKGLAFPNTITCWMLHCTTVPLGVMVRGTLEWLLEETVLQRLFEKHAPEQYTRELTISALVNLLIQVSAGAHRSVYAAYKADQASPNPTISTSYQAVYTKLGRVNPSASESLLRFSAEKLGTSLQFLPPADHEPLPGYRLRILDGNVLTGTD